MQRGGSTASLTSKFAGAFATGLAGAEKHKATSYPGWTARGATSRATARSISKSARDPTLQPSSLMLLGNRNIKQHTERKSNICLITDDNPYLRTDPPVFVDMKS